MYTHHSYNHPRVFKNTSGDCKLDSGYSWAIEASILEDKNQKPCY